MRLVALVWPCHAWMLAEETPGAFRRLTGDPWADDGAMPLLLARIGRETHIGTLAEHVAYESPRARLTPVLHGATDDDEPELIARFLLALDEHVRRRFPQDPLSWRFAVAAPVTTGAFAALSAACWMAGLGEARVDRLPAWPVPPRWIRTAAPSTRAARSSRRVLGYFDGDEAVAAIASDPGDGRADGDPGAPPAVLVMARQRAAGPSTPTPPGLDGAATADIFAGDGEALHGTSADSARRRLQVEAWHRRVLDDGSELPRLLAVPDGDGWSLRECDAEAIRDGERRRWRALAGLLSDPDCRDHAHANPGPIVAEWGQRNWAARLAATGARTLTDALGSTPSILPLEALPAVRDEVPAVLDWTLAFAVESAPGGRPDHKIVASRGAALPFRSEHIVYAGHAGKRALQFELHALSDESPEAHRIASGALTLPAESRRRTAIQLTVTCHACGGVELAFDIPSWHFRSAVLIDAGGRVHADARRRAAAIETGT